MEEDVSRKGLLELIETYGFDRVSEIRLVVVKLVTVG